MPAVRANCFDASALVKLEIDETGSDVVRAYFNREPTKYTTPFCFYEALSVLKGKWLNRKEITKQQYLKAAERLGARYRAMTAQVKDLDFTDRQIFPVALQIANVTSLDLSDAFQILSVMGGYFAPLVGDSTTVLVTADAKLAEAARNEGLRVWSVLEEPPPP